MLGRRLSRADSGVAALALWLWSGLAFGLPPATGSLESAERAARELALTDISGSRQVPFAGFAIHQPARREWTVFTLYLMFREAADTDSRRRESYWLARRVGGSESRRAAAQPAAEWASSDSCAALDTAVRSIGDVLGERLETVVPGEGEPSEADADPTRFRIWTDAGRFRGTGFAASITVTTTTGSPGAKWIQETAASLAGCWTNSPPAGAPSANAASR